MRQTRHYGSIDAERGPADPRHDGRRRQGAPRPAMTYAADDEYGQYDGSVRAWNENDADTSYPGASGVRYASAKRRALRDIHPIDDDHIPIPPIAVAPQPPRGRVKARRGPQYDPADPARLEAGWDDPLSTTSAKRRAVVPARPLSPEAKTSINSAYEPAEFTAELDTLIKIAATRQQPILPGKSTAAKRRPLDRLPPMAIALGRALLVFMAAYYVLSAALAATGHSALPLAPVPSAISGIININGDQILMDGKVVTRVQPFTQMRRADLYNNQAQFDAWGGSACSAAVLGEILTAYGVQGATIGRMIDELGSDISTQWGLETYDGFNKVAQKHGFRADIYLDQRLTYKQMLYLTNTLGIPVIVNVRATTGYYHYLSGGHFLVMTGGDDGTIKITDSSLYYIKSLPISTFMGMFRNRTVVIVPRDYHYTLPA